MDTRKVMTEVRLFMFEFCKNNLRISKIFQWKIPPGFNAFFYLCLHRWNQLFKKECHLLWDKLESMEICLRVNDTFVKFIGFSLRKLYFCVRWGREPLDAMSLRYADMSLPDLLGRPSLGYAVMSLRNTLKCAFVMCNPWGFYKLVFKFK